MDRMGGTIAHKTPAFVSDTACQERVGPDHHQYSDASSSYGCSNASPVEVNKSVSLASETISDGAVTAGSIAEKTYPRSSEFGEKIFVLRWSRHPRELAIALRQNPLLEPIRAAAIVAGHTCDHATGAMILLYPDQYKTVLKLISGLGLRPYHTVVNEAFRPLVEDAAMQLRSKANIRLRGHRPLAILPNTDDSDEILVVENSFLDLVHVPAVARSHISIAQTDTIGYRVRSPRDIPLESHRGPYCESDQ